MKKTKLRNSIATLSLAAMLALSVTACSNGSSDSVPESDGKATFDSVDDAAFTVLRSLADLTQYDESAVKNDDDSYSGIETLPSGWQSMTFACDQGFVLDSTAPKVRSIPVNGFGDALEFFSSLIGEVLTEESLSGDTYKWFYDGLGSFTFKKVTGNDDLFATVDVSLTVMPDLKQLRFISVDSKELSSSNSFSGLPYYHAGDVIKRNSDNTYWICVRPAGGPYKKDKSYWIALDTFKNGASSIISYEEKEYDLYYSVGQGYQVHEFDDFIQKWKFAKNLMDIKTAKAAFHTFSALVTEAAWNLDGYEYAKEAYEGLKSNGIDLLALHRLATSDGAVNENYKKGQEYKPAQFLFAYGSPKNESNRTIKLLHNAGKAWFPYDTFKTVAQVKRIQPFLNCEGELMDGNLVEKITTKRDLNLDFSNRMNVPFLWSLSDGFDEVFMLATSDACFETNFSETEGSTDEEKAQFFRYDFSNFLSMFDKAYNTSSSGPLRYLSDSNYARYQADVLDWRVIISPEMVIKDNKGTKDEPVRPDKKNAYEDIYVQGDTYYFDYWTTFEKSERYVDGKKVDWKKENK